MIHPAHRKQAWKCNKCFFSSFFLLSTDPAVDYHHVEGVGVEPALHGFADGADLIQGGGVHVWPARVQRLKTQE